jgi:alpha-mannosidase
MTLNPEWLHRVLNWRRELPKHFYSPLGAVEWSGYTTTGRLSPTDAKNGQFAPMPAGTAWGRKWDYGWFKGSLKLLPEAAGKRIVLRPELGGQTLLWADGRLLGCRDREHVEMTLAMRGVTGEVRPAGRVLRRPRRLVVGEGPVPYGVPGVPEPSEPIAQIGETTYGIWNDEFYQAWLDVETLYQTREDLDPDSLRVAEIDAGLKDFTLIADMELLEEMLETVPGSKLGPLLEYQWLDGTLHHRLRPLDVAWLWRLRETEFKITGTIANQLELAAEYPEYKFIQSQPHLFWMIKTLYPDVYEEVKSAVRSGHIVPEGGMWVEADTNLSGGESLIRQFLYGKRFFREEFGVECELLWLPDVFGYSGQMPQIMRGCGIQYFGTQKIFWTYNGGDKFPHNLFTWRGIDGSEVLAHIFNDYNSMTDPKSLNRRWSERVQKDG